jgi:hypothetical protein
MVNWPQTASGRPNRAEISDLPPDGLIEKGLTPLVLLAC